MAWPLAAALCVFGAGAARGPRHGAPALVIGQSAFGLNSVDNLPVASNGVYSVNALLVSGGSLYATDSNYALVLI